MQVAHPTNDTCAFFQAIDNYSTGQGIAFTMLPSVANFGCNTVLRLILFTRWLLEPVYRKRQAYNLDLTFHPEELQEMTSVTWDERINCIQQKQGDILGRALKDLDIYNLRPQPAANPPVMVVVDTTGTALQETQSSTGQPLHYQTSTSAQNTMQLQ